MYIDQTEQFHKHDITLLYLITTTEKGVIAYWPVGVSDRPASENAIDCLIVASFS